MKVLKTSVLAILFSFSFLQLNATTTIGDPQVSLEKQLNKMVTTSDIWDNISEDAVFRVAFTINAKGEIIVLSTDNENYDAAIKSILNYQKVKVEPAFYNKVFFLPVKLNKPIS